MPYISVAFEDLCSITNQIGMGLVVTMKRLTFSISKPIFFSSDFIASSGISVVMPQMTTIKVRSSGRGKEKKATSECLDFAV